MRNYEHSYNKASLSSFSRNKSNSDGFYFESRLERI